MGTNSHFWKERVLVLHRNWACLCLFHMMSKELETWQRLFVWNQTQCRNKGLYNETIAYAWCHSRIEEAKLLKLVSEFGHCSNILGESVAYATWYTAEKSTTVFCQARQRFIL